MILNEANAYISPIWNLNKETHHINPKHIVIYEYRTTWAQKPQVGLIVFKFDTNYKISPREKWGILSKTFPWDPTNENFGVESSPKQGYKVIYYFGQRIQQSNRSKKCFIKFEGNQKVLRPLKRVIKFYFPKITWNEFYGPRSRFMSWSWNRFLARVWKI